MTIGLQTAAYIGSTVLFILALGGLSNQEKAKRAVWFGIVGMAIAVLATIADQRVSLSTMLIAVLLIGGVNSRYGHRGLSDDCRPAGITLHHADRSAVDRRCDWRRCGQSS